MGILLAFVSLVGWGVGDFLIQRGTRRFGNWITLFWITGLGALGLLPFVWRDIPTHISSPSTVSILFAGTAFLLLASIGTFQGLKVGKIAAVEPINTLEVVVTATLGALFIGELFSTAQAAMVFVLLVGIFLISTKSLRSLRTLRAEKGALFAFIGSIALGISAFLIGVGARQTDPLFINWFASTVIAVISLGVIIVTGRLPVLAKSYKGNGGLILTVALVDNIAWVAYAAAALTIPIALVSAISETYVAFAAVLGLLVNKEWLRPHQFVGLGLAVVSSAVLAATM